MTSTDPTTTAASSPVTEPCPHCGCPVAPGEWFEDDEGTLSCTCCALRDECDPNDPDCTCRREADAGTESARPTADRLAGALNVALSWHDNPTQGTDAERELELAGCREVLREWTNAD